MNVEDAVGEVRSEWVDRLPVFVTYQNKYELFKKDPVLWT
jgi:hypothetical protein